MILFRLVTLRFILTIGFLFFWQNALAQVQPQQPVSVTDTTQTVISDSTQTPLIPIPLVGSVDRKLSGDNIITFTDLQFKDYRSLTDIMLDIPGTFNRDLGSPGLSTGLTLRGMAQNSIAFLSDGILLNEPMTGVFNLALYPTEQIERIEIIPMTRAFLYATNSTGGAINLVSKSKKAIRPQSRIRYSESAHGYGFIDGMVSQDIIRGLNVTAGLQHTTYGGRFPNSDYDGWNARFKLRYNISNAVNIFASEMYNSTQQGLNGGISSTTPDSLRFEDLQATVNNTDSYEKVTRHDLQLGTAVRPDFDPNGVNTLTLYLSTNLREYRDEENRPLPNGIYVKEDHRSQWYGVRFMHGRTIGKHTLDIGAEVQSRAVIASPFTGQRRGTQVSFFGIGSLYPLEQLNVSVYSRYDIYLQKSLFSFGSDIRYQLFDGVEFFGGYSHSYRYPSKQESYLATFPGWPIMNDPEIHTLFESGIKFSQLPYFIEFTYFRRLIDGFYSVEDWSSPSPPPLFIYDNFWNKTLKGVSSTIGANLGWLKIETRLQFLDAFQGLSINNQFYRIIPKWNINCGIYFEDNLIDNRLGLKTGFRGKFFTDYYGQEFNQQYLAYSRMKHISEASVLDFLLIAHIGDAYIHLIWENLLNRKYITTDFYPMPDRAIRFGVSWDFLD